jgi:protein arginine kinase
MSQPNPESWQRMVLKSMPKPLWLTQEGPHRDVCLSTRVRIMRNLVGHRFPTFAEPEELNGIMADVLYATEAEQFESTKNLTNAERDYLVASRLVSPEFPWTLPGRALLTNTERSLCVMVNEEDHVRAQAILGGWNLDAASPLVSGLIKRMSAKLDFCTHPKHGYLAASPPNCGSGRRTSIFFHLIGLAHSKRLPSVLQALATKNIVVRGLFGESSRAIGAFLQVSVLREEDAEFRGACEYLVQQERIAREDRLSGQLRTRADQARDFALANRTLSLADSVRILGWIRWAAAEKLSTFPATVLSVDHVLASLELRPTLGEDAAGTTRADLIHQLCES